MGNTNAIQAIIEIFGAVITVVVAMMFVIITSDKKKSEKNLFFILLASGFSLLVDAGWYLCDGNNQAGLVLVNLFCNFACFICNPCMVLLLNRYIGNLIKEDGNIPNKIIMFVANIFAAIALLMPITNLFYKWIYYIDGSNIYHRMTGWYVYTICNSLSMLLCIASVVIQRKSMAKKRRRALYVLFVSQFIGIGLQIFELGISFIQLGTSVGILWLISNYLFNWIKMERQEGEVSEDRKKIWLIEGAFSIMILFISTAIITCIVSVKTVSKESSEQNSIALAYMVCEKVESTLAEPINVSKTMAQAEIIRDALTNESLKNTSTEADMLEYMKRLKNEYGYPMIFVALENSGAYYTYDGFSRYMDISEGADDQWYSDFKNSDRAYEINLDFDKDNDMRLSAFVNVKIFDDDGRFIGVCGVGMSLEQLMDIFTEYENRYSIDISLTDHNGLVQIDTDREIIEKEYRDITSASNGDQNMVYYSRDVSNAVMIKYMQGYDGYIVINDDKPDKVDVLKIVMPSMIIYILGVIIMLVFSIVIGLHERYRSKELRVSKVQSEMARAASEAKGRFLANMSHEIRTPLNAVLGMDTMILRESNEQQIREYALNIQNAGNILLSLINDILDISKIESGKMEIVPVEYDMAGLIYDVLNVISVKANAKMLDVKLDIDNNLPSILYGDNVRIRQIILNIMNNAIKYTEKGCVTLVVKGTADEKRVKLNVCVRDTGIGIKEEDIQKLFDDFVRVDESRNKNVEGTGLGLSITSKLLELMDSKLEVASVYGEGSEFSFDLEQEIIDKKPIGDIDIRINKSAKEYSYESLFTAPEASVLVVDDSDVNRVVFINLLKETKVMIDEASSGKGALEKVYNKKYDIIFMDHMMPDMDGIEVLKKMKANSDHPNVNTPIIVLTANAISGVKEGYLSVGFTDYISKPIIPEQLEKMLFSYLPENKKVAGEKRVINVDGNETDSFQELPVINGVDWNYAKMHFSNYDTMKKTLESFVESINPEADSLEDIYNRLILDESDSISLDEYRIKVHSMKSTSTLLGCVPIGGLAATLEEAARKGDIDSIRDMTFHFISLWREYQQKFSAIIKPDAEKLEITDISLIRDYIIQLKDAVEVFDVHGADDVLAKLKKYEYKNEIENIMYNISIAVNGLDVDEVSRLCDQVVEML